MGSKCFVAHPCGFILYITNHLDYFLYFEISDYCIFTTRCCLATIDYRDVTLVLLVHDNGKTILALLECDTTNVTWSRDITFLPQSYIN